MKYSYKIELYNETDEQDILIINGFGSTRKITNVMRDMIRTLREQIRKIENPSEE